MGEFMSDWSFMHGAFLSFNLILVKGAAESRYFEYVFWFFFRDVFVGA